MIVGSIDGYVTVSTRAETSHKCWMDYHDDWFRHECLPVDVLEKLW